MLLEFISNNYEWIKAIHIISMTCWMAGMFYLPRLYVYHVSAKSGSELDKTFQIMERRLLRYITNPAMIITIVAGLLVAYIYGWMSLGLWFHIKLLCVLILLAIHGMLAKYRKDFILKKNKHSARFYKILNESITVVFVIIVIMVVIKPFE